jgi:hypothetical protein
MKKTIRRKSTDKDNKPNAMIKKEDVPQNADMHIDQDFPGYPHGHSKEEIIKPVTKTQKKTAGISHKDDK